MTTRLELPFGRRPQESGNGGGMSDSFRIVVGPGLIGWRDHPALPSLGLVKRQTLEHFISASSNARVTGT